MATQIRRYVNKAPGFRQYIGKRDGSLANLPGPGDSLGQPTNTVQLTGTAVPYGQVDAGVAFQPGAFDGSGVTQIPLIDDKGQVIGQANLASTSEGLTISSWLTGAAVDDVAELVGLSGAGLILSYTSKTVAQGNAGSGEPVSFIQEAVPLSVTLVALPTGDSGSNFGAASKSYSPGGRSRSRVPVGGLKWRRTDWDRRMAEHEIADQMDTRSHAQKLADHAAYEAKWSGVKPGASPLGTTGPKPMAGASRRFARAVARQAGRMA